MFQLVKFHKIWQNGNIYSTLVGAHFSRKIDLTSFSAAAKENNMQK